MDDQSLLLIKEQQAACWPDLLVGLFSFACNVVECVESIWEGWRIGSKGKPLRHSAEHYKAPANS